MHSTCVNTHPWIVWKERDNENRRRCGAANVKKEVTFAGPEIIDTGVVPHYSGDRSYSNPIRIEQVRRRNSHKVDTTSELLKNFDLCKVDFSGECQESLRMRGSGPKIQKVVRWEPMFDEPQGRSRSRAEHYDQSRSVGENINCHRKFCGHPDLERVNRLTAMCRENKTGQMYPKPNAHFTTPTHSPRRLSGSLGCTSNVGSRSSYCEQFCSFSCPKNCEYCYTIPDMANHFDQVNESSIESPRRLVTTEKEWISNTKRHRLRNVNAYLANKYQKLQKRMRSRSSPPRMTNRVAVEELPGETSESDLDLNMNGRCSVCDQLCCEMNQIYSDSNQWEHLQFRCCETRSLLGIEATSLLANEEPPSKYNDGTARLYSCEEDCCRDTRANISRNNSLSVNPSSACSSFLLTRDQCYDCPYIDSERSSFCEECALQANQYVENSNYENYENSNYDNYERSNYDNLVSYQTDIPSQCNRVDLPNDPTMSFSDMKKYGVMSFKKPRKENLAERRKRRRRRRRKDSSRGVLHTLSICFPCTTNKRGIESSSSGGSGSDGDGEDAENEFDEEFEEHGAEVSDGEDSDGGDSGSGSGEGSMNSAELFDDQLNDLNMKDSNNQDGSNDDGGDGGSGCSDSLTELGSEETEEESSSSEDDSDSFGPGNAGTDYDSIQSIIICEKE